VVCCSVQFVLQCDVAALLLQVSCCGVWCVAVSVAVYRSVLQCIAVCSVCCSVTWLPFYCRCLAALCVCCRVVHVHFYVMQCVSQRNIHCNTLQHTTTLHYNTLQHTATLTATHHVLQCLAVYTLRCRVCRHALQRVAMYCSVLQCLAACGSVCSSVCSSVYCSVCCGVCINVHMQTSQTLLMWHFSVLQCGVVCCSVL